MPMYRTILQHWYIDVSPDNRFQVLISAGATRQKLAGNLLQCFAPFNERHPWSGLDRVFYYPWRHGQNFSLHDLARHRMHKAVITDEIAVRVRLTISFLCNSTLSIKCDIEKITY